MTKWSYTNTVAIDVVMVCPLIYLSYFNLVKSGGRVIWSWFDESIKSLILDGYLTIITRALQILNTFIDV